MLLNAVKCQSYRVYSLWVIKGKPTGGTLPPPHQNKGYSSRSGASSWTKIAGASISDILSMVSWSNESVWQKYYNKPVLKPEASFQRKLLWGNK